MFKYTGVPNSCILNLKGSALVYNNTSTSIYLSRDASFHKLIQSRLDAASANAIATKRTSTSASITVTSRSFDFLMFIAI